MLLCGSRLRPPDALGMEPLLRLTSDSGCAGISVGDGCTLANVTLLVAQAARAGLGVGAMEAPLPEARLSPGRRLPHLGSIDRAEREAACGLAAQILALAGSIGTPVVSMSFGPLALAARMAELGRLFRRREIDEGEAGEACLRAALGERRAKAGAVLDACRRALDALCREGERRGVRIALELAATPWGAPSPREGLELLAGYDGAGMGVVFDPARLAVMGRLGLAPGPERLTALRQAALLVADNQAVGVETGYLRGLGEPDDGLEAPAGIPAGTPVVLLGGADATSEEVLAAAAARSEKS